MKVILYMAITANGYIAKENNETPWSNEEWESFSEKAKEIKNLIIGRKTFEIMNNEAEFQKIGNPFTVIVSNEKDNNSNFAFVESPEKALELLEEKGFEQALVAGGGMLNSSFLQKGLIDEIYLDVEPFLFGSGIKLFAENDYEAKLELLSTKQLSKNTIQLHYKVFN
ncbi:MAG: dihydrofolate reductase family protein [bacterium]|nr:dihydrofolate reductase family protein [bacterium]